MKCDVWCPGAHHWHWWPDFSLRHPSWRGWLLVWAGRLLIRLVWCWLMRLRFHCKKSKEMHVNISWCWLCNQRGLSVRGKCVSTGLWQSHHRNVDSLRQKRIPCLVQKNMQVLHSRQQWNSYIVKCSLHQSDCSTDRPHITDSISGLLWIYTVWWQCPLWGGQWQHARQGALTLHAQWGTGLSGSTFQPKTDQCMQW